MIQFTDEQIELEMERRHRKFEEYTRTPEYQNKLMQRIKINDACINDPKAREKYSAIKKAYRNK